MTDIPVHDKAALLERLTDGVERNNERVSLVVGSAVTAAVSPNTSGVLSVGQIIELIRGEFDGPSLSQLDNALRTAGNPYQAAFEHLASRRGQQAANQIVKRAVWAARKPLESAAYVPSATTSDDACTALEEDTEGWLLPPAVAAIGQLASNHSRFFANTMLTTNFDPLLEVAILRAGGKHFRTVLHADGDMNQSQGEGSHVVHLHGYWYGSDTLHTVRQLKQARPRLSASIARLVRGSTVLVSGYGAWDDIFTSTLLSVAQDNGAFPEILWTFHGEPPQLPANVATLLDSLINRGRATLYAGIDCHAMFPELVAQWDNRDTSQRRIQSSRPRRVYIFSSDRRAPKRKNSKPAFERGDQDRPPLIDVYVGRDEELTRLKTETFGVASITGIGGQGKSALAARYFSIAKTSEQFDHCVWRDCKEESDRFESQLVSIIEALSVGAISASEIAKQPAEQLTKLFLRHSSAKRLLLIFDNIDHYIDLDSDTLTGAAKIFIDELLMAGTNSQVLLTCRPNLRIAGPRATHIPLGGLDLPSTIELFEKRGASATHAAIAEAHEKTRGHAFWLDLLAAQVAKRTNVSLDDLIQPMASDGAEIPTKTLQSIWTTLREREKLALHALAETVRPTTEAELSDHLDGKLNFNQMMKALNFLRGLNLLVIKQQYGEPDALELHPLVRAFIRKTFPPKERSDFIDGIIKFYKKLQKKFQPQSGQVPPIEFLRNWTESAEVCIYAGRFREAFSLLAEVRHRMEMGGYPGEFARVARLAIDNFDWDTHSNVPEFDKVLATYAHILAHLGREDECRKLLSRYRETLDAKDSRYIKYCDIMCYVEWVFGDFKSAIKWGISGRDLKAKAGADVSADTAHNLALAQRDAGEIDAALQHFLIGAQLDEVINPDTLDEERDGAFYGNVGRCLHLMGQIDPALICYQKSAISIERDEDDPNVMNQGYIRHWISELLLARGEVCASKYFLQAAIAKYSSVSPLRQDALVARLEAHIATYAACPDLPAEDIERFCLSWMYGRETEFRAAAVLGTEQ